MPHTATTDTITPTPCCEPTPTTSQQPAGAVQTSDTSITCDRFTWERAILRPRNDVEIADGSVIAGNGLGRETRFFALVLAVHWDHSKTTTVVNSDGSKTLIYAPIRASRDLLLDRCCWVDKKSLNTQIDALVQRGFLKYIPGGKGQGKTSSYQLLVPRHLATEKTINQAGDAPEAVKANTYNAHHLAVATALADALKRHGADQLVARLRSETRDWPILSRAIAQSSRGRSIDDLMRAATDGDLPPAASIRRSVSRYFAARIQNLGTYIDTQPSAQDRSPALAPIAPAIMSLLAAPAAAGAARVRGLNPVELDGLAARLDRASLRTYHALGPDPVMAQLAQCFEGWNIAGRPIPPQGPRFMRRQALEKTLRSMATTELTRLVQTAPAHVQQLVFQQSPTAHWALAQHLDQPELTDR